MIKVFLEDNDGNVSSIDYGLEAKNYKRVVKVEMLEETSKLKDSLNTIFITDKKIEVEFSSKPFGYYERSSIKTNTEKWYSVSVLCDNCLDSSQIAIKKGEPYQRKILRKTQCPKCRLFSTLKRAKWDGHQYVRIEK